MIIYIDYDDDNDDDDVDDDDDYGDNDDDDDDDDADDDDDQGVGGLEGGETAQDKQLDYQEPARYVIMEFTIQNYMEIQTLSFEPS